MTAEIERAVSEVVRGSFAADDEERAYVKSLCMKLVDAVRRELANVQVGGVVSTDQETKWRLRGGPYDTSVFIGPPGQRISIPKDDRHHVYERTGVIEATYVGDVDFEELQRRMRQAGSRPAATKAKRNRGIFRTIK